MDSNALHKLEPIVDDPRFEGFGFGNRESLRGKISLPFDFLPDDMLTKGRKWTAPRLGPYWKPQPVVGRVNSWNDYPCIGLTIPAFSRRAVDALREFLEPNGELLPLISDVGEYYAFNVTTVADILDEPKCEIQWHSGRDHTFSNIFEIWRYVCHPHKMKGLSICRLVERAATTFVTQVFVDRVREHNLQGFHFTKLWPLPAGVKWREEEKKQRAKEQQLRTRRGRVNIKANSVVLLFPVAKTCPSTREQATLDRLIVDLESFLGSGKSQREAHYFGSLESTEGIPGDYRFFLSCPDADALVEKLRPWLAKIEWPGMRVIMRYGEYVDENAPEVDVTP